MRQPDETVRAFLARIGDQKNPIVNREVAGFYAGQLYEAGDGIRVTLDLAYGDHPRQAVDVFAPAAAGGDSPVVVFVHGGSFTGGARVLPNTPFYGNVGRFYANRGIVAVIAGYRLAPEARWPAVRDDVAAVVAWIGTHIAEYGGDPARIVLHGHSAGGAHVADYLYDPARGGGGVAGAVLQSAILDPRLHVAPTVEGIEAYYGTNRSAWPSHIGARSGAATLIVDAERDPAPFKRDAAAHAAALAAAGAAPLVHEVPHHGHLSAILSLGTGDPSLGDALVSFVTGVGADRAAT